MIPFLKYPPNPPTVGDPATIGARTAAYFAMVGLSLLAVLAAWHASRVLKGRGTSQPVRHVVVGLGLVTVVAAAVRLAAREREPRGLSRGAAVELQALLPGDPARPVDRAWACVFGALCERASRRERL